MKKNEIIESVRLDRIVGGGQAIGTLDSGKKALVWGGLPGEIVTIQVTKKKSNFIEGVVTTVEKTSSERVEPRDPDSFLSTSPWQIMTFDAEQHYKSALVEEAFELHDIVLPQPISTYTDGTQYEYRNKIEYSFWFDTETEKLQLAFFRRGTHGKIAIETTSLASAEITKLSTIILDVLNELSIGGRQLKTLMIRSNQAGETAWQLYVKDTSIDAQKVLKAVGERIKTKRGEIIFSEPKSPASVITKRLATSSDANLEDKILDTAFEYPTESFFQINIPVYEQVLKDMQQWIPENKQVVDMYSGVGTIGLTIGGKDVTMVEINQTAVDEMKRNIARLGSSAKAVLAASEQALDFITTDAIIIVDPPRAGLHEAVVERLLEQAPARIVYLSCNPVTQARDVARLATHYGVRHHQAYNFFPRTPHIEHLVILDTI